MEYQIIHAAEKDSTFFSIVAEKEKQDNELQVWEIGQIIDEKYEILSVLAKDHKKIIHKVQHCQWNIPLAVRSQIEKETQVQFFHQAQRWVELGKHPNVVSAYYVQNIGNIPRLFVEYVTDAKTLEEFMEQETYDIEIILDIAIQIAWGMQHAHDKGLLHGDLRPGNIFITNEGEVKIADFRSREDVFMEYTVYMPPEQLEKAYISQASMDIYAYGMILYELCTGKLPFQVKKTTLEGSQISSFRNKCLAQPFQEPHQIALHIPIALSQFIMQCLSIKPQDRPKKFHVISDMLKELYLTTTEFTYPREEPQKDKLQAIDLNNRALTLIDLDENFETIEQYFQDALKADPFCLAARINLPLLRLRNGKATLRQLRDETDDLLEHNKEVVAFYRGKIALETSGFLEESLVEVQDALKEFPDNKELLRLEGILLYESGYYEQAIVACERLRNIDLPLKKDLYYLGCSYLQSGQKKKALEIWDKALELYPKDPDFIFCQAITYAKQQRLEETYNKLRELVAYHSHFWALLNIAEISSAYSVYMPVYKKASPNFEESKKIYEKLLEKAPILPRLVYGYQHAAPNAPIPNKTVENQILSHWHPYKNLKDHQGGVQSLILSQDGRIVIAGSGDSQIKVWDIKTGKCKNTLQSNQEGISQVAISHDGHFIVSIGHDSIAMVWDLITGECVAKLEGHVREITSVAITTTGYIVTGSLDKTIRIWDLGALTCRKILRGHTEKITSIAVTHDGRYAVSADENGRIGVWEIEQGNLIYFLERHTEIISCLTITRDNQYIISGGWDQKIVVSSLENPEEFFTLEGHTGLINSIILSSKETEIFSACEDKTIKQWDLQTKECIKTFHGHTMDVTALALAKKDLFLASSSWDHTIRIWNTQTGECISVLESHKVHVNHLAITPNAKYIISASDEPTVRIWVDTTTQICPLLEESPVSYLLQSTPPSSANFATQRRVKQLIEQAKTELANNNIITAIEHYREIQTMEEFCENSKILQSIYETATKGQLTRKAPKTIYSHRTFSEHQDAITCLWSDTENVISASKDNTIKIWALRNNKSLFTLEGHTAPILCLDISPNKRYIASGSKDKTVRIWEVKTGHCINTIEGHSHWIEHVKFTTDNRTLFTAGRDGQIKIWETKTGHKVNELTYHTDLISDMILSPDETLLFTASHDRTIRVWNIENSQCLHTLEKHTEHIKCLVYLPKYHRLISGGWDNEINIWDIEKGECLQTLKGHTNWINKIVSTPDESKLISISLDKTIKIWDLETYQNIATLQGHKQDIIDVICTDDNQFCISASQDKTIKIWNIDTEECYQTLEKHTAPLTNIYSVQDCRYLLSSDQGSNIVLWEFDWLYY